MAEASLYTGVCDSQLLNKPIYWCLIRNKLLGTAPQIPLLSMWCKQHSWYWHLWRHWWRHNNDIIILTGWCVVFHDVCEGRSGRVPGDIDVCIDGIWRLLLTAPAPWAPGTWVGTVSLWSQARATWPVWPRLITLIKNTVIIRWGICAKHSRE